jgi:hypothetical protein
MFREIGLASGIVLMVVVGACASESQDTEDAAAKSDVVAAPCSGIEEQLLTTLADHQSCSDPSDCQAIPLYCLLEGRPTCSASFYANRSVDMALITKLNADLDACVAASDPHRQCGGCTLSAAPDCVNGKCAPEIPGQVEAGSR